MDSIVEKKARIPPHPARSLELTIVLEQISTTFFWFFILKVKYVPEEPKIRRVR